MSDIKKDLFQAISNYSESENIEIYFENLVQLQKEQTPWLDESLVELSVFQSFAKYYDDYNMDYMICQYMDNSFSEVLEKTAA